MVATSLKSEQRRNSLNMEAKDFIPEIIAFCFGLFLTFLGVPSVADLGIMIISSFQNAINVMPNVPAQANFTANMSIFLLRLLGAVAEIEIPLRITVWFLGRNRDNYN
jgi:hypothetical protein